MLGWLIGSTDGITSDYKAHSRSMTQVMFDDIETCELQFQKYILDRLVGEGKSKTEVFGMYRDKIKDWHWTNGLVLADFLNGQKQPTACGP